MTPAELYRALYRIRKVEEEVAKVYPTDKIQSPIHLSIGQELASVAVCAALKPTDKVFGSYRSHALYLAKGGDLKAFVAELYGKATGCAKGKGGSMHLVETSAGLLGTSAIVGSLIPVACGYAWAQKQRKTGVVTAVFFGDGAAEEGCFHESLNFAVVEQLPILFVCENNGWAIHTPLQRRSAAGVTAAALGVGIPCQTPLTMSGMVEISAVLVDLIRQGAGPRFLEARAPRLKEHVGPGEDWSVGYRNRQEDLGLLGADPLAEAGSALDPVAKLRIQREVDQEIGEAFAFAEASPAPSPRELWTDLYAPEPDEPPEAA